MPLREADLRIRMNEEVQNLRGLLREQKKIIGDYKKEHGVLSSFFREVAEACSSIEPAPIIYKPSKEKKKVETPCSAVLQITDTHMGAIQEADEIEGFNEFSPEICEQRCLNFIRGVLDWIEIHRSSYIIDEAVVLVTGDLISGDIWEDLKVTNAWPAPVQAVKSGELLAKQISMLAPHFKNIRVEFVSEDNHARLTKKPQAKEAGMNSLNYIVGYIANKLLREHSNVAFNIYPQYEKVVEVQGRRYLILHGHQVRGWAGFPWYGVERKVAREALKRMNEPDFRKFHRVIAGHWHTPLTHPWYWFGGSVSGTDAYDHKEGRHSSPSQPAWIVHSRHTEFDRTDFNL